MAEIPDPVAKLRRWEAAGANWRVASRAEGTLRIELVTCTGDEVVEVLASADPGLLEFVGERISSQG